MILLGGEVQWVKFVEELAKCDMGNIIYILDEFIIGLYFEDIWYLLCVINKFVDKGNIVIIIEYNMDVIKVADYIIDMGLEGGYRGGIVVCIGIFEQVVKKKDSYIGQFLKQEF